MALSAHDQSVLDRMFGGGSGATAAAPAADQYAEFDAATLAALRRDEAQAVALAGTCQHSAGKVLTWQLMCARATEAQQLAAAEARLSALLARAPAFDSARNNRAQVRQLLNRRADAMAGAVTACAAKRG